MKHLEKYKNYNIYLDSRVISDDFYCRMGRLFADRDIRRELEGPLDDSDQHTWLIVMYDDEIVAISSYQYDPNKRIATFNETYVFPNHRNCGLFARLFDLKYRHCVEAGARLAKGMANEKSSGLFEQHDWTIASQRGKWTRFEKVVLGDE